MTENMPSIDDPVEFVGPFVEEHVVTVHGRRVPGVRAFPGLAGRVSLSNATRGIDATVEECQRWLPFVADLIAESNGFVSWPESDADFVTRPLAPRLTQLGGLDAEGDSDA